MTTPTDLQRLLRGEPEPVRCKIMAAYYRGAADALVLPPKGPLPAILRRQAN